MPRHLTVAIDKYDYKLPHNAMFGGAIALTDDHIRMVNGFPNRFWGWGGEASNQIKPVVASDTL